MKKVFKTSLASMALASILSTYGYSVNAAGFQPVYSFKNLGEFTNLDGQEFTKLLVTCNGDPVPRYIQRIVGQKNWCIDGQSESCSKERIETATVACTTNAPTMIANVQISPEELADQQRKSELKEKLLAEQIEVEKKQIDIQSRRVELQTLELKLAAQKQTN